MAEITLARVTKAFGEATVIRGVDLAIEANEFVVFVGPSGCGKSTLLRLIAGLEDVSSGAISIGGEDVTDLAPADRGIAMVFQSYALYPHMTVAENMSFGLARAGADRAEIRRRVAAAAEILQIGHLLERLPKALSGGQRQRVAIGRAIVRDPKVFLFDEPLSNLDAALRVQMRIEIAKLHRRLDATMIYVTHDQIEAMTLADRIVVLDGGVVQQFGAPLELYHHPQNRFVAGFIGSPKMNFVAAEAIGEREGGIAVRIEGGSEFVVPVLGDPPVREGPCAIGVRPEHFADPREAEGALAGDVVAVERLGSESYIYLDLGGEEPLTVRADASSAARPGERIEVGVPAPACYLFAASGECAGRAPYGGAPDFVAAA